MVRKALPLIHRSDPFSDKAGTRVTRSRRPPPRGSPAGGGGRSLISYFPMPFSNGARIEIENQSGKTISALYFNIDYEEMEQLPDNTGRFHAWFHREITDAPPEGENEWGTLGKDGKNLTGEKNYVAADIHGS